MAKKDGAAIAVFGALPKKGGAMHDEEDHDEARDLLMEATGWNEEKVDALHEYIMSCIPGKSSAMDEEESEPAEGEEY